MLNPMVPHLAEELWEILGHTQDTLAHAAWPKFVPELAAEDQVEIVVQVNGRVKGRMLVEAGLDKEALAERVLADPKIAQLLDGQRVVKMSRCAGQARQLGRGLTRCTLPSSKSKTGSGRTWRNDCLPTRPILLPGF